MKQTKYSCNTSITISFLYLSAIVLNLVCAQEELGDHIVSYCPHYSHYNQGSQFQSNLNLLYNNFTGRARTTNFYNFTIGEEPTKVYGLFFCDSIGLDYCHECIRTAVGEAQERCAFGKEYIVWYVGCMARYVDRPILSINDVSIYFQFLYPPVIYSEFDQALSDTFISMIDRATTVNSSTASDPTLVNIAEDLILKGHADCTPDLSSSECLDCLQDARVRFPLIGARRAVLLQPSCKMLYDFDDTRSITPAKEHHVGLWVSIAVAGASLLLNAFLLFLNRKKRIVNPIRLDEIESNENLQFEFEAIKSATDDFSPAYKLGCGGFGVVYMGKLPDGQAVAVKRLSNVSGQGIREFKTEASLAAKLQHKNLVKVYGFCLQGDEKLLVYEFVPNKSLDRFLFDEKQGLLKWETRYKILVGIARGLSYLHDDSLPKIIHRDLKPSNILLDREMNPKIADFGMARLFGGDQTQGNTNRVAGTFGYMAPEYVATGNFSVKSDIFSYGVILLELVSGRRNSCFDLDAEDHGNLLQYAWKLWDDGNYQKLVDLTLGADFTKQEVERCIHVGLLCTQEDPTSRPSIASVLLMLNIEPFTLSQPACPPAFLYKQQKLLHSSHGTMAEDVVSDLSPR